MSKSLDEILPPDRIRRMKLCVDTLQGYGFLTPGQDGFQALVELRLLADELSGTLSKYGYCPHCGKASVNRERRPGGNDTCESGHVYPTSASRHK